jgi:CRISPR/Cas system-associated endonuclease Cas1
MRIASRSLAEKFRRVVDRMVAALHQQRAIEARRVLRRYRHLLDVQHETLPLREVIFVSNEEGFSENAHQFDAREHSASHSSLERA